jgi:hypothetical protein
MKELVFTVVEASDLTKQKCPDPHRDPQPSKRIYRNVPACRSHLYQQ